MKLVMRYLWIVNALVCSVALGHTQKTILVTGGEGYIGSHTALFLADAGYRVVILDRELKQHWQTPNITVVHSDFANTETLNYIFSHYTIDTVMHFAASIFVGDSVTNPQEYYRNNITNTLTLLDTMLAHNVKKFIFSSTCAIFGNPTTKTVTESHQTVPTSPYAKTKLVIEFALEDYARAYGLQYVALRYFNVSGACPDRGLTAPITHVTDIILDAIKQNKTFHVFGNDYPTPDGTGVRDYIHVKDIALAHIKAMDYLNKKIITNGIHAYKFNLGTGHGYSVQELISAAELVTGKKVPVCYAPRREGDLAYIKADPTLAEQELGWKAENSSLEYIMRSTIEAQQQGTLH